MLLPAACHPKAPEHGEPSGRGELFCPNSILQPTTAPGRHLPAPLQAPDPHLSTGIPAATASPKHHTSGNPQRHTAAAPLPGPAGTGTARSAHTSLPGWAARRRRAALGKAEDRRGLAGPSGGAARPVPALRRRGSGSRAGSAPSGSRKPTHPAGRRCRPEPSSTAAPTPPWPLRTEQARPGRALPSPSHSRAGPEPRPRAGLSRAGPH